MTTGYAQSTKLKFGALRCGRGPPLPSCSSIYCEFHIKIKVMYSSEILLGARPEIHASALLFKCHVGRLLSLHLLSMKIYAMPSEAVLAGSTENSIAEACHILGWMVHKPCMNSVCSPHQKKV